MLITTRELAQQLGLPIYTIQRLYRNGVLDDYAVKFGGRIGFNQADFKGIRRVVDDFQKKHPLRRRPKK